MSVLITVKSEDSMNGYVTVNIDVGDDGVYVIVLMLVETTANAGVQSAMDRAIKNVLSINFNIFIILSWLIKIQFTTG